MSPRTWPRPISLILPIDQGQVSWRVSGSHDDHGIAVGDGPGVAVGPGVLVGQTRGVGVKVGVADGQITRTGA